LSEQDLRDIGLGSAVLGTGGGGDPYYGTLAALGNARRYRPPRIIAADELADDDHVLIPFMIGSPVPLIEKFTFGKELQRAFESMRAFLNKPVAAIMPVEIGGVNSMVPLALGSLLDIPVVDADCMGRAFPEGQLVTLTLDGIGISPMALADERGNSVVLNTIDNFWAERFGRSIAVEFGAIAAGVGCPLTGRQVRESTILGSLSYAERIGRGIREAHAAKQDGVAAILRETNGVEIFRGKIVDVQRRIERGWTLGEAVLEGLGVDSGARMVVQFQNENLVTIRDGEIVASVPDLITIIDAESGEAITTEHLRYGFRVVVVGIPCDAKWRTPAGIDLAGPRHFGYDIEYQPIEQRWAQYRGPHPPTPSPMRGRGGEVFL
jgi:DUF917 family protein